MVMQNSKKIISSFDTYK